MILSFALLLAVLPQAAERAASSRLTAAEISGHIRFLCDDLL